MIGLLPGSLSQYIVLDPADQQRHEFSVSRLRKYRVDMTDSPAAMIALDSEEHEVECIVDHNIPSRYKPDWDFKVKWKNLPSPEEDSWVPWREAKKLAQLDVYRAQHPELNIPAS